MYANINIFTRSKNTWYVCVNIILLHCLFRNALFQMLSQEMREMFS